MIKLVIFDLGGVIIDFNEAYYCRYLSERFNVDFKKVIDTFKPLNKSLEKGEIELNDMYSGIKKGLGIKGDVDWNKIFYQKSSLDLNMMNLVNKLSKSYKIAILSNISISRYLLARKLYLYKLHYDRAFLSGYLGMVKPEQNIYKHVINQFNIKPEESIFIDNLKVNTYAAEELGIKAITFVNYDSLLPQLKRYGIKV
ncbi:HAD superfamily hydrolase [Candidatus Mancarchaeum acidiphilum]|uniref:HAD superfamily hydrolase n=1 Tax=Candidatus Mancarchaeum acidiphilum TaxID=1920749 RepID=A0A218NNW7_9ARCH|nr:HAD family phosphatase [Candidatus Mancarchaeum acidiphilum]ASI14136.1 HAD superfamily hydrolase [Candidatus Mancarchaeum acidiphilum]